MGPQMHDITQFGLFHTLKENKKPNLDHQITIVKTDYDLWKQNNPCLWQFYDSSFITSSLIWLLQNEQSWRSISKSKSTEYHIDTTVNYDTTK